MKRYEVAPQGDSVNMREAEQGEYILFDDHEAALAEAALKARNDEVDVWAQAILDVVGPHTFEAIVRKSKERFDAIDAALATRKEGDK